MKISERGLNFVKGFESFVPFLYDDKKYMRRVKYGYNEWTGGPLKGTLTIGYGHTADAKAKVDMSIGARLTEVEASKILDIDLDEVEDWVNKNVKVPISQGQFDALVSFGFNCGTGNLSKITRVLNTGDYTGARAKFDQFVYSRGEYMNGLQRRRDGEQELWDSKETITETPKDTVDHPAEVDTPTNPSSTLEKVTTVAGPVVPVATAALADWRTAAIVAGFMIIGFAMYIIYRRNL